MLVMNEPKGDIGLSKLLAPDMASYKGILKKVPLQLVFFLLEHVRVGFHNSGSVNHNPLRNVSFRYCK